MTDPTRWEYRKAIGPETQIPNLNVLGRDGWEVIAIYTGGPHFTVAYLKRPLPKARP